MTWQAQDVWYDFINVANLAGAEVPVSAVEIEELPAPHTPPSALPNGKMAIYIFFYEELVLKVGKVGDKSQARYTSQHYNPRSAQSTLAASMLSDTELFSGFNVNESNVGQWIKQNVNRTNFILDANLGIQLLTLLEAFLQCRLKPRYEGFKSQKGRI